MLSGVFGLSMLSGVFEPSWLSELSRFLRSSLVFLVGGDELSVEVLGVGLLGNLDSLLFLDTGDDVLFLGLSSDDVEALRLLAIGDFLLARIAVSISPDPVEKTED